ncbi:MAG: Cation diffusion facilitator family transporter [Hyphomicrobiales bacterium]|nr:Cation diffusion facilitator family transporter [Hyphomicrobiales bacterium]
MEDLAKLKSRAALASIGASAALTVGKLVAGLLSGSLALMSEAMHGLLDTGATILTWFAVRAADRPADDEHHYGHGKIEAVAALAETGLLMVLSVGVLFEAGRRLFGHEPAIVEATWLTFGVLIVSILVDAVRWRSLDAIARRTKSDALAADALHFSSDLVASALVLAGLVANSYGFRQGDTLAAIGVSLFIGIAGYRLGRRTIDTLTDKAPEGFTQSIRETVEAVPGVAEIEDLRLRAAGPLVIGELSVGVSRTLPVERIMGVKQEIARAIAAAHPDTSITITANMRVLDDETVIERVLMAAARRRLPIHHVTVQEIDGVKSIGLDLEVDGRMTHGEAHDVASALETGIRDELGADVEVDTHIEPMEIAELEGRDSGPEITHAITAALAGIAAEDGKVADVHDVRVRSTSSGLVVHYHCRVDPSRTVADVHTDVDKIDRRLQQQMRNVVRVVGHAEPRPA